MDCATHLIHACVELGKWRFSYMIIIQKQIIFLSYQRIIQGER